MAEHRTEPIRGDLVEIAWEDINEAVNGDPDKPELAHRKSFGLYWGKHDEKGTPCIVTTTTIDGDDHQGESGYCCYPVSNIRSMKIVRRVRVKKSRKKPEALEQPR